ncbi:flagellar filament outer layer protein [Spirochaetia bacterium]|nr:flagellar filament outer layer protein [Spirochaetia bacterium]
MKRIFILVTIVLFSVGTMFADEKVLIDFSKLTADITTSEDSEAPDQNQQTVMDFSGSVGGSYQAQAEALKTSLAITNWEVVLGSSSRTVTNIALSYTVEAPSKQWDTVLGVRIHFPLDPYNSTARIVPPFSIPAYDYNQADESGELSPAEPSEDGTKISRFEDGYGVIKNVGTIKAIAVNVYGLNFPHSLSVIIYDQDGNEKIIPIGSLAYDGWRELTWSNPQYVSQVRNRELRIFPLYPYSTPYIRFGGFQVQRDGANIGGDFIAYFKDVKVIYDQAVLETERDIDDEGIWSIITERESGRQKYEMSQFGQAQVQRYLDAQRQAKEDTFTPSDGSGDQD